MSEITTIRVTKETNARIQKHGTMTESMDDLLNRILDKFEGKTK